MLQAPPGTSLGVKLVNNKGMVSEAKTAPRYPKVVVSSAHNKVFPFFSPWVFPLIFFLFLLLRENSKWSTFVGKCSWSDRHRSSCCTLVEVSSVAAQEEGREGGGGIRR